MRKHYSYRFQTDYLKAHSYVIYTWGQVFFLHHSQESENLKII